MITRQGVVCRGGLRGPPRVQSNQGVATEGHPYKLLSEPADRTS